MSLRRTRRVPTIYTTFDSIFDDFDRVFNSFEDVFNSPVFDYNLPVNVIDNEKGKMIYELSVPGANREDLKISIKKNRMTVSLNEESDNTKKEDNQSLKYTHREFNTTSKIKRTILLPKTLELDTYTAKLKDGILKIEFSKSRAEEDEVKNLEIT